MKWWKISFYCILNALLKLYVKVDWVRTSSADVRKTYCSSSKQMKIFFIPESNGEISNVWEGIWLSCVPQDTLNWIKLFNDTIWYNHYANYTNLTFFVRDFGDSRIFSHFETFLIILNVSGSEWQSFNQGAREFEVSFQWMPSTEINNLIFCQCNNHVFDMIWLCYNFVLALFKLFVKINRNHQREMGGESGPDTL